MSPPLDDVRARVREDVLRRKALTLARAEAAEAATMLQQADDFGRAADEADLTVGTSTLLTRGSPFPEIGVSTAVEAVAFELPVGGVSSVVEAGNAGVVVRVVEREDVTFEEIEEAHDTLRTELLQSRQNQFYSSYLTAVQEQLSISIDAAAFDQAVGAV